MRTDRFAGLTTPLHAPSLHRIKTAFSSPPRHTRHRTTSPSSPASTSTSPLSEPRTPTRSAEDLPTPGVTSTAPSSPSSSPSTSPRSSLYGRYGASPPTSSTSARSRIGHALRIRAMGRRPSVAALQMEEERKDFSAALGVMEPRPRGGLLVGGIFEVLLEGEA